MEQRFTVRVRPRSARSGVRLDADGSITVDVRAAPEHGRATEEAVRTLAEALGVRRSDVTLLAGTRSRTKVVRVDGMSPEGVRERLRAPRA